MGLRKMPDFNKQGHPRKPSVVKMSSEIPKDMDIFYRDIHSFLPEGKTLDDLTEKELREISDKYRFDYYVPGIYQGITGFGHMR